MNIRSSFQPIVQDALFFSGPDGRVYEFPREVAENHLVSDERLQELGHPPELPLDPTNYGNSDAQDGEVDGRHFVTALTGNMAGHREVLFGTAITHEGVFMTGYHYHPDGGRAAVFVNGENDIGL